MQEVLRRKREEEEAFTLIELMVVVLIIAILIAIAIPTFLGAQNRARDRAAQSDLRNALTAAKTIATDAEGYFKTDSAACSTSNDIDTTAMASAEGSLSFTGALPASGNSQVGVIVSTTCTVIELVRLSAGGTMFGIQATQTGVVGFCKGSTVDLDAAPDLTGDCTDAKW